MQVQFMEFRNKEIISIRTGEKLGYVDDLVFDVGSARIIGLVIYGRRRLFGLFGQQEDLTVPWEDVEIVGDDTVLVRGEGHIQGKKTARISFFQRLLNEKGW